MIRHIVFFSAKNRADIPTIRNHLQMLAQIPHVQHFEATENTHQDALSGQLPPAQQVDVVVYAEFTDADALSAYKNHSIYQECITLVRPLRELRLAADIVATSS